MKVTMLQILNAVGSLNTLVNLSVPFSVAVQMQKLTKQINDYSETFQKEREKINELCDGKLKEIDEEYVDVLAEINGEYKDVKDEDLPNVIREQKQTIEKQKQSIEKERFDLISKLLEEEVNEEFIIIDFTKLANSDVKVQTMSLMGIEPFAKFE